MVMKDEENVRVKIGRRENIMKSLHCMWEWLGVTPGAWVEEEESRRRRRRRREREERQRSGMRWNDGS